MEGKSASIKAVVPTVLIKYIYSSLANGRNINTGIKGLIRIIFILNYF